MFKYFICLYGHERYRSRITLTYLSLYLSVSLTVSGNKGTSVLDVVFGNIAKFVGECLVLLHIRGVWFKY